MMLIALISITSLSSIFAACIEISAAQQSRMPVLIVTQGTASQNEKVVVDTISSDIMASGQFEVRIREEQPKFAKDFDELLGQGYSILLFLTFLDDQTLEWRLYDVLDKKMIEGKRLTLRETDPHIGAHLVAAALWEHLTQKPSPFTSVLTFIKKKSRVQKKHELCISTCDGKKQKVIYSSPSIIIAPNWSRIQINQEPFIILSEFTQRNVRLRAVDVYGKSKVVLDMDGTHVGISYSHDSHDLLYCKSGEIWRYSYDAIQRKGIHQSIIKNNKPCSHPILLSNGDIVYGCNGKIYRFYKDTGTHEVLTDGYCVAPAYNAYKNNVVYSKRIRGVMQICSRSLAGGPEVQLTHDAGDKIDPSLSPCGSFVAYCLQKRGRGCIVTQHCATGTRTNITDENDDCGYPAWSSQLAAICFVQLF